MIGHSLGRVGCWLGWCLERIECKGSRDIAKRPRGPSGVAVFMPSHSKTPYITPSMDFYSRNGVVWGRRGPQLEFSLGINVGGHVHMHIRYRASIFSDDIEVSAGFDELVNDKLVTAPSRQDPTVQARVSAVDEVAWGHA